MAFKQYNGVLWEKLKGGSEEEFAEYMPMDANAFATSTIFLLNDTSYWEISKGQWKIVLNKVQINFGL